MRCAPAPSMERPFCCPRNDRQLSQGHRRHSITSPLVDEDPEQAPITENC